MVSERSGRADGSCLRYAQCWEDADVLLEALDIRPGHVCLSIASGGDNTLALAQPGSGAPSRWTVSPAQIACLELKVAAYRLLEYEELRETGRVPCPIAVASALYRRLRSPVSTDARRFWDARLDAIAMGIGGAGELIVEAISSSSAAWSCPSSTTRRVALDSLLDSSRTARDTFYDRAWNTWRWRLMFHTFFSRVVIGCLGRDPSCFRYVEGGVASRILARTRYALTVLNPAENPYIQWILMGRHTTALPCALRPDCFGAIRANLDRLEWHCCSLGEWLAAHDTHSRSIGTT